MSEKAKGKMKEAYGALTGDEAKEAGCGGRGAKGAGQAKWASGARTGLGRGKRGGSA